MRIISQNGQIDIPYEHSCVRIDGEYISARTIGYEEKSLHMAGYSTLEKAEKAMKKLHECYTGVLLMQNVDFPKDEVEQLKSMTSGFICVNRQDDNVRIEPMHMVFCFPQEDEI